MATIPFYASLLPVTLCLTNASRPDYLVLWLTFIFSVGEIQEACGGELKIYSCHNVIFI